MPSFFDLQRYAATGIAAPDMTAFDKMRALAVFGGGTVQTMTGIPPLSFKSDGTPLISLSMLGNTQQTGTPSADNIIMPTFCGKLVGADWTIPITCAGQTTPVYLGQVSTVRRVKKYEFTGLETFGASGSGYVVNIMDAIGVALTVITDAICSHYQAESYSNVFNGAEFGFAQRSGATENTRGFSFSKGEFETPQDFKTYLAQQYTNGTPVTIWYVLATPTTGIVNEPLAKIGDYADELNSEDATVTIPTANGNNTLTVDADLQPSEMTITYKG